MWRILLATAFAIATVAPASAGFISGNRWKDTCPSDADDDFCIGYVAGVIDWYDGEQNEPRYFCLPESVTLGQAHAVTVQYIEAHPEEWHVSTSYLVMNALKEAFPCPAQ